MSDYSLSVILTRTLLGLSDLQINDNNLYRIAGGDQFLSGAVTWERESTKSPYVEGEFTTNRRRSSIQERIAVEVFRGDSTGISGNAKFALEANVQKLIDAFTQDAFVMNIVVNKNTSWQQEWHWACEAADYAVQFTGPRFVAQQAQAVFTVIRNPVPTDLTWSTW